MRGSRESAQEAGTLIEQRSATMPRLRYIEDTEKPTATAGSLHRASARERPIRESGASWGDRETARDPRLIASAERTGAPLPRVGSLMVRSKVCTGWVEYWNKVLYEG